MEVQGLPTAKLRPTSCPLSRPVAKRMADEDVGLGGLVNESQSEGPVGQPPAGQGGLGSLPAAMEVATAADVSHQFRQISLVKFMEARVEAFTAIHNLHEVYTRLFAEDRVRPLVKASLLLSWVRMDLPTALRFYHKLHAAPVLQWVDLFAAHQGKSRPAYDRPSTLFSENDTVDCLLRGFLARIEEEGIPETTIWQEVADAVTRNPHCAAGNPVGSRPASPAVLLQTPIPPPCPVDSDILDTGSFWDGLTHGDGPNEMKELATDFARDLDLFAKNDASPSSHPPLPPGIQLMDGHSEVSAWLEWARASEASSETKGTKRSLSVDRTDGMWDEERRPAERAITQIEALGAQAGADLPERSSPILSGWAEDMAVLLEAAEGSGLPTATMDVAMPPAGADSDGTIPENGVAGGQSVIEGSSRWNGIFWTDAPEPPIVAFPGPVRRWEQWPPHAGQAPKNENFGSSWEDTLAKVRRLMNASRALPYLPAAERQQQVFNLWSPSGWGADYAVLDVGAVQLLLFSTPQKWQAGLRYIEDYPSESVYWHFRTRVGFADRNWNRMLKQAILSTNAIAATGRAWQPDPLPPPVSRGPGTGGGKGKRKGAW